MNKNAFEKALAEVRKNSPKRKFNQSLDLIVSLKSTLDLKKPENQIDHYILMPHDRGKKVKIGAFVQTELFEQAKQTCDEVIRSDDFSKLTKPALRKMARENDYFIAQASIMPQIAKSFGRLLGPRNKMPNPKAGCVVPPTAQLKPLVDRLKKTVRILVKLHPVVQILIGKEDMKDEELLVNMQAVYSGLLSKLTGEESNIRSVMLKFTMGPAVRVGEKEVADEEKPTEEKKEASTAAPAKEEVKPEEKPSEEPKEKPSEEVST